MILRIIGLFTLVILIFGILPAIFEDSARDYVGTIDNTRPIAQILVGLLSIVALWGIFSTIKHYRTHDFRIAWQASFQMIGWLPIALSAGGVILTLMLDIGGEDTNWFKDERLVASIVPLAIGITSAMIFSPPDDPTIETQLTLPRPITWLLLERLLVIMIPQIIIALIGTGVLLLIITDIDVLITLIRWLPPSIFMLCVGSYVTLKSRNIAFGMVSVGLLWAISLLFEELFLPTSGIFYPLNHIQPYLWVINPYAQPHTLPMDAYWLNRLCVTLIGIALLILTVRDLRDEERVLLGNTS